MIDGLGIELLISRSLKCIFRVRVELGCGLFVLVTRVVTDRYGKVTG
jgi:hypothetical protein